MKVLTLVICLLFVFEGIYFRGKSKYLLSGIIVLNLFFFQQQVRNTSQEKPPRNYQSSLLIHFILCLITLREHIYLPLFKCEFCLEAC